MALRSTDATRYAQLVLYAPFRSWIADEQQHRVIPHGKRRFALTSRHIDLSKLDTDEEREYSKQLGTLPERANDPAFQPANN